MLDDRHNRDLQPDAPAVLADPLILELAGDLLAAYAALMTLTQQRLVVWGDVVLERHPGEVITRNAEDLQEPVIGEDHAAFAVVVQESVMQVIHQATLAGKTQLGALWPDGLCQLDHPGVDCARR